ncbi:adenylate kinase [Cesiribacter andamanensis]|uniref:Adenylate kinase n=1 Tax=Cesiribacter andamanensis AMV16 TaxID=1279009 RepID=M7N3G3_9BACT|nr:adenylate kinase [Cesiribacter andamanensis]EMR01751.1 Adenylate kinase [Cesiribacter andamanensis AMV16]
MLNIVLFGAPGAGKGTQSQKLIEKYNLLHLSTGDIFRKHLSEGTELGKEARQYMDNGKLVPDAVVINMVRDKIESNQGVNGFIFDGFPRTVPQAQALDQMLQELGLDISCMVALDVPEEELKRRIAERGKVSGRADDQDPAKINTRIQVYRDETLPVAEYYKKQHKFVGVDGVGSIDEIFEAICSKVEAYC